MIGQSKIDFYRERAKRQTTEPLLQSADYWYESFKEACALGQSAAAELHLAILNVLTQELLDRCIANAKERG